MNYSFIKQFAENKHLAVHYTLILITLNRFSKEQNPTSVVDGD